jgi:S-DNA-T family DNA segregation ATPase FtsK/SpoIIIE
VALERRFLGDGSFQAGIRATELRPGKDVGTSIVTGATPERFEIVKWFYIEADDDTGYDDRDLRSSLAP